MFFIGIPFIRGMATGAALAVLLVMLAAITLLPAILGFAGRAIDRFALPSARRSSSEAGNTIWARWSRTLQAHPWPAAAAGLLILVLLAVPVFSMRLGVADAGNVAGGQTIRRAYDLLSEGFGPGSNGPLLVVAEVSGAGDMAAMQRVADRVR